MADSRSKYNEQIAAIILRLAKQGRTDEQIAEIVGVSRKTIYNWKEKYEGFAEALENSKDTADDLVEASLFQRATGYTCPEVKVFCSKDGLITEHVIQKHYAPDVTACIFWLKNRRPVDWRERVEHKVEKDSTIHLAYNLDDSKEEKKAA